MLQETIALPTATQQEIHDDRPLIIMLYIFLQVFVALRLWERKLTAEQMQALCRGLAACLPASPTPLDALEWKAVAEELALIEPFYSGSQKVQQRPALPWNVLSIPCRKLGCVC